MSASSKDTTTQLASTGKPFDFSFSASDSLDFSFFGSAPPSDVDSKTSAELSAGAGGDSKSNGELSASVGAGESKSSSESTAVQKTISVGTPERTYAEKLEFIQQLTKHLQEEGFDKTLEMMKKMILMRIRIAEKRNQWMALPEYVQTEKNKEQRLPLLDTLILGDFFELLKNEPLQVIQAFNYLVKEFDFKTTQSYNIFRDYKIFHVLLHKVTGIIWDSIPSATSVEQAKYFIEFVMKNLVNHIHYLSGYLGEVLEASRHGNELYCLSNNLLFYYLTFFQIPHSSYIKSSEMVLYAQDFPFRLLLNPASILRNGDNFYLPKILIEASKVQGKEVAKKFLALSQGLQNNRFKKSLHAAIVDLKLQRIIDATGMDDTSFKKINLNDSQIFLCFFKAFESIPEVGLFIFDYVERSVASMIVDKKILRELFSCLISMAEKCVTDGGFEKKEFYRRKCFSLKMRHAQMSSVESPMEMLTKLSIYACGHSNFFSPIEAELKQLLDKPAEFCTVALLFMGAETKKLILKKQHQKDVATAATPSSSKSPDVSFLFSAHSSAGDSMSPGASLFFSAGPSMVDSKSQHESKRSAEKVVQGLKINATPEKLDLIDAIRKNLQGDPEKALVMMKNVILDCIKKAKEEKSFIKPPDYVRTSGNEASNIPDWDPYFAYTFFEILKADPQKMMDVFNVLSAHSDVFTYVDANYHEIRLQVVRAVSQAIRKVDITREQAKEFALFAMDNIGDYIDNLSTYAEGVANKKLNREKLKESFQLLFECYSDYSGVEAGSFDDCISSSQDIAQDIQRIQFKLVLKAAQLLRELNLVSSFSITSEDTKESSEHKKEAENNHNLSAIMAFNAPIRTKDIEDFWVKKDHTSLLKALSQYIYGHPRFFDSLIKEIQVAEESQKDEIVTGCCTENILLIIGEETWKLLRKEKSVLQSPLVFSEGSKVLVTGAHAATAVGATAVAQTGHITDPKASDTGNPGSAGFGL